jgi:hypothetical protein
MLPTRKANHGVDSEPNWRTVANGILYSVQFKRQLDDAVVDRIAHAVLTEPLFDLTATENYESIVDALRTEAKLTELIPAPHGERDFRDFLLRLVKRLDALRPWPEASYQRLDVRPDAALWDGFSRARPIAALRLDSLAIERRLHRMFQHVAGSDSGDGDDSDRGLLVLVLRLASGEELALVAAGDPGGSEVTLRAREPLAVEAAEQLLTAFRDATGFTPDEVTALPA